MFYVQWLRLPKAVKAWDDCRGLYDNALNNSTYCLLT